jgi:tRNA (mo5U34)-methyltransferase
MPQETLPDLQDLRAEIQALGPWFHNLHLPNGIQTAPHQKLGDYPAYKWNTLKKHLPKNLSGWNILDIGCNAGFYSFELAARGGNVFAIDSDERYLKQARWAQKFYDPNNRVTFEKMQIYDLAELDQIFDLVIFMGVFYHLRYPLLGLDIAVSKTANLLIFQSLMMPGEEIHDAQRDYDFEELEQFLDRGWPKMAFIEHRFANDPTNWWVPNRSAVEAMLRSAGLRIERSLPYEIYITAVWNKPEDSGLSEIARSAAVHNKDW